MRVLFHFDLSGNELRNAVLQNLATAPTSPKTGQFWFDTAADRIGVRTAAGNKTLLYSGEGGGGDATTFNGQAASFYLARSNHTGTQAASTISDLATVVQGYRLDQFAAPTSAVSFNSQRITAVANPTVATDVVNLQTLDARLQGQNALKDPVRLVLVANDTLSGLAARDGVTPIAGDRVLATAQTTATQNGIWVAASGAWTRATDADASGEIVPGTQVAVREGTVYADSLWSITSDVTPIIPGTTAHTWTYVTKVSDIVAGAGLTRAGNTLNVATTAGSGITVNADDIAADFTVVVRKAAFTIGDAAATVFTLTHNFGTRDVQVAIYENATPWEQVYTQVRLPSTNTVELTFATAPTANQFRVVIQA